MVAVGEQIGPYRVTGHIGRGGMGEVFRVEHAVTHRSEAMKVLSGANLQTGEDAARFLREIQLQASLDHPAIAAVHNAFWDGDRLIMVMELVDGEPLQRILERERLPLNTALGYARQMLDAVGHAHRHGIIHRDISTANLLVTSAGTVKLTDFGLAKAPGDLRLTQTGAVMGSVYYMSPEQVHGSGSDERSDIYSMGAVLYEMVTGVKPFAEGNVFTIMSAHVERSPRPPQAVDPSLPREVSAAILRALEKEPARRFATANEFALALASQRSPKRRLWTVAAIFTLLLVAGAAAAKWLHDALREPPPPGVAVRASIPPARLDFPPLRPDPPKKADHKRANPFAKIAKVFTPWRGKKKDSRSP